MLLQNNTNWFENISKIEKLMKLASLDFPIPCTHRALGMIWNINQDKLTVKPVKIEITLIESMVFYHYPHQILIYWGLRHHVF